MFLDLILLLALIVCICYCIMLTRRISQLDANRANLTNMFSKFDESILKANENINSLSQISQTTINNLSELIDKGQVIINDLTIMNDLGNNAASRIETAINTNKASSANSVNDQSFHESNNAKHENKLAYNINQISSPADSLDSKKTLSQNQYFSSLKKINTKNDI